MASYEESLNISDTSGHHSPSATRIVLVSFLYLPFVVITITGNIFVLVAYKRDERIRKNTTNTYILNLAIADLLVGMVMLINTPMYVTDDWYFGRDFCILVWAIDFTSTDMSVITIIAISLDRYLMVRNTIQHRFRQSSRRRIALIFVVIWSMCLLVHLCIAFIYSAMTQYQYLTKHTCNLEYRREKGLVISMFLVEFVLPVMCLFFLNTKVFLHIHRQGSRIKLNQRSAAAVVANTSLGKDKASGLYETNTINLTSFRVLCSQNGTTYEVPTRVSIGDASSYAQTILSVDLRERSVRSRDNEIRVHRFARARSSHHKAAKLLTALLIVFILSWLPYYIYDCIVLINKNEADEVVTQILTFILWGNSAVNPLLYAFTNIHYKQNFMQFLHLRKGLHVISERITYH